MPTFSLENRGHNLLRVGRAGGRISELTPGDKIKAFIQALSKVNGQRLWNEYVISEALKVKKQNSVLRPEMNRALGERIIEHQTWSQLSSVSLAGELARFQGECGRCSLRQTLKVGNAV